MPGGAPAVKPGLAAYPGVEVVDISNRELPLLRQKLPVVSVGGVHTTRSFDVPGKGEYTVSVANGIGAAISKVDPTTGTLTPVGTIEMDELHDTFIQQDPLTGKTLLYIAGGFDSGFYIYDVSDPANPVGLGEWDPTPECENDWYSHTIDVTTVNGRRIVTLPVELIDFFGDQSRGPDEQDGTTRAAARCQGNGDFAGPLFIVDATDFSKLGANDPTDSEAAEEASDMKAKSEESLITVWSNAANRAGGELVFSPHNQQIVGNRIYLSGYHSGVTVLDATEAFEGKNVRPKELGVIVPHGADDAPDPPGQGRRHAGLRAVLHGVHRLPAEHLGHAVPQGPGARGRHGRRLLRAAPDRAGQPADRRRAGRHREGRRADPERRGAEVRAAAGAQPARDAPAAARAARPGPRARARRDASRSIAGRSRSTAARRSSRRCGCGASSSTGATCGWSPS